ncbi:MFS transporter [Salidesulfovibrio onnuriiensis]|uniref:MFS transporter n=1 Tax=Salidesulfovibrio onnuriiensis TaxID=2583823 RepID=UPI0011CBA3A0|nr:MFS transporter [Salidesulfovibrio onnuriiensis]
MGIDFARGRSTIPAVMLAGFLGTVGLGVLSFALPLFGFDAKVGGTWIGTAFSGYFLARLILAPLAGMWADRFGPRPVLLWASVAGALLPLGHFLVSDLYWFHVLQFGLGLAGGFIKPVSMAILGAATPTNRLGVVFGRYSALMNAAFFLGPLLGGVLYYERSFTPVILFLAASMLAGLVVFLWFVPRELVTRRTPEAHETRERERPETGFAELLLAILGRTAGVAVLLAFFPVLLAQELSRDSLVIGLVCTVPSFVACVGLALIPGRIRLPNQTLTAALGILVSSLALYLLGEFDGLWGLVLAGAGIGFGRIISIPSTMSLAALSGHGQGKVFGLANGAASLGFVIGPLAGGLILRESMEVAPVFRVFGVLGVALCLPMLISALRRSEIFDRRLVSGVGVVLMVALLALVPMQMESPAPVSGDGTYLYGGSAMGTVLRMTLVAPDKDVADKAAAEARRRIATLQHEYDFRYREGSVGRINLRAGGRGARVSQNTYQLIERALDFGRKTDGIFDITIGAVTVSPLYFARSEEVAQAKRDLIDYRLVRLDPEERRVTLPKPGMAIDLGGIAKGAIIDAAVESLRKSGIQAGIVEAGGDFYCFGDCDWTVGIRHPREDRILGTIQVREKGVCGSGDYYQYIIHEENGREVRRHHILDVGTLRSASDSIGVTVVAENAERADALATSLFIAGPEQGRAILKKSFPSASAMWVLPDMDVEYTDNFPSISREK